MKAGLGFISINLGLALALSPPVASGHHGSEFLAVEDYGIGHPGEGLVSSGFDLEAYPDGDELSSELGFFISPLHRVGIGVDGRFTEDANGDWVYSSVTPRLQIQLTDPHKDTRFRLGMSVGYQFAEDVSVQDTMTTFEDITVYRQAPEQPQLFTATIDDGGGQVDPPCNPLFDLDCDPAPAAQGRGPRHSGHTSTTTSTSAPAAGAGAGGGKGKIAVKERVRKRTTTTRGGGGHQGIHNHDARQWTSRLVLETSVGKTKIAGNLIGAFPEDDHAYWGYGIGLRRPVLVDGLAVGVEAVGDFLAGGEHELIGSAHYNLTENLTLRTGVGVGLDDGSPDCTLRTGLMLRF